MTQGRASAWRAAALVLGVGACLGACVSGTRRGEAVPRPGQCFDLAPAPAAVRATAERFLLAAGDREALYTLDGGIKPVSSDVADFSFRHTGARCVGGRHARQVAPRHPGARVR